MANLIGQRIGQYEVLTRFGEGGMATVYRARQLNIKREVAIKVILPNLAKKEDFHKRFEQEAEIIASLSHPHIVKIFDYAVMRGFHLRLIDPHADPKRDLYYFVMELLLGGSLNSKLSRGPLAVKETAHILDQMAPALDYAHGRALVHRDLKPPNILFDDQDNAFLTDFGIAKLLEDTSNLTQDGMTMGTPSYMAPEQWAAENMGAWTDIYAMGVVVFEMLTGKLPFVGGTPFRVMHMHLNDKPPSVYSLNSKLPPGIDPVIQKVMAKKPEDRYKTTKEFALAFRSAVAGAIDGPINVVDVPAAETKSESAPDDKNKAGKKNASKNEGASELSSGISSDFGFQFGNRILIIVAAIALIIIVLLLVIASRG